MTSYKKDSINHHCLRGINKKGKVNQWCHFIDPENVELLLIKYVDVVLWIGQSPGKGVFVILIYVQFHQQSICYCSIVFIHLLFSSTTARTSAKRFWIWACWDRAHYFYIFMNCAVHWRSFSKDCFLRLMRMWHKPVWVYGQEVHMCRGHRGGWKSSYMQEHSNSTAAEEQNYLLIFEWCRNTKKRKNRYLWCPREL